MNFGHLLLACAVITFIAARLYQDPKATIESYSSDVIVLVLFCFLSIIYNIIQAIKIKKLEKANRQCVKIDTLDDILNQEEDESVEDDIPDDRYFIGR